MNCKHVHIKLGAYLDEELSIKEHHAISKHIEQCPDCQSEIIKLKKLSTAFQQTKKSLPSISTDVALAKMKTRLSQQSQDTLLQTMQQWWFTIITFYKPYFYASVGILLIIGVVTPLVLSQKATTENTVSKPAPMIESIDYGGKTVFIFQDQKNNGTLIWLENAPEEQDEEQSW